MRSLELKRRTFAALLPLVGLVAGVVFGGATLRASADSEPGTYLVVRHVLKASLDGQFLYEEESRTTVSAQFVVNNHIWGASSIPVPVSYNPEGQPQGHDVAAIIQQAMGTWNAVPSGFSFSWSGASSGNTGSCGTSIDIDGVNTIQFLNLAGLTLGQTCTIYTSGANTKLVEFDMQLDDDALWNSALPVPAGTYDLPTTILHELGHAAGLGHSTQSASVMYFQVNAGQNKRTLTADDVAGLQAAYPGVTPTATTATTTPSPSPSPTVTNSPSPTTTSSPSPAPTTVAPDPLLNRVRAPALARD